MEEYLLEMKNITMQFPGVKALDNVSFKVKKGEIHAIVGENGAGKSTLIKIICGVYNYGTYQGQIIYEGEEIKFHNIHVVEKTGIVCIHQELNQVPELSVSENIFLDNKPNKFGVINLDEMFDKSRKLLEVIGMSDVINPNSKINNLGIGQRQLVEISKGFSKEVKLLILDEPTAALTESETKLLLGILDDLRKKGVTCIYISHKLDEVMKIADSITVMRDGQVIETRRKEDLDKATMVKLMVGRELKNMFPRVSHQKGDLVFEVKNYNVKHPDYNEKLLIDNVSLKAYKGEILGIGGLVGAGRTELFTSIYGAFNAPATGEVYIDNKKLDIKSPMDALDDGIFLLTEDRRKYGLNLMMSIKENTILSTLKRVSNFGVINDNEAVSHTKHYMEEFRIKAPNVETAAGNLSGGNQQKVIIAKALMKEPKVMILDEPTRGIDVGAKYEIYKVMNELIDKGVAIIMISSEMEEILGMSDRILVMSEGRLTGEFDISECDQEKLMQAASI